MGNRLDDLLKNVEVNGKEFDVTKLLNVMCKLAAELCPDTDIAKYMKRKTRIGELCDEITKDLNRIMETLMDIFDNRSVEEKPGDEEINAILPVLEKIDEYLHGEVEKWVK